MLVVDVACVPGDVTALAALAAAAMAWYLAEYSPPDTGALVLLPSPAPVSRWRLRCWPESWRCLLVWSLWWLRFRPVLFASTSVCSALASVTKQRQLVLEKHWRWYQTSIGDCDRSGMPVIGVMAIYKKPLDFKIADGMR